MHEFCVTHNRQFTLIRSLALANLFCWSMVPMALAGQFEFVNASGKTVLPGKYDSINLVGKGLLECTNRKKAAGPKGAMQKSSM